MRENIVTPSRGFWGKICLYNYDYLKIVSLPMPMRGKWLLEKTIFYIQRCNWGGAPLLFLTAFTFPNFGRDRVPIPGCMGGQIRFLKNSAQKLSWTPDLQHQWQAFHPLHHSTSLIWLYLYSPSSQIASVVWEHHSENNGGLSQWIIRVNITPRLLKIHLSLLVKSNQVSVGDVWTNSLGWLAPNLPRPFVQSCSACFTLN